jgi:BirA family biotin operon repressor/biotin-[acetyl-CoA-carboxylase] ligase
VNNRVAGIEPPATSLKALLGRKVARREILRRFLDEFEAGTAAADWDAVIPEWKRFSVTLGRPVRILAGREEIRGVAIDVDEDGGLMLQVPDGSTRKIVYGDCFAED